MAWGSERPSLERRGVGSPAPRDRAATGPPGAAAASRPARPGLGLERPGGTAVGALYLSITSAAAVMRSRTALGHIASCASAMQTRIVLGA